MTARVHVLLGAGGVGKTTLAAAYAIALARSGARVGLLGIDPSRRLQDALAIDLSDTVVNVPGVDGLSAALLVPEQVLRRWVAESNASPDAEERLKGNPFFVALADRMASATDILAAIRVTEWAERDPSLTDLVVDTAPGLDAIEFLGRPRHLETFLRGTFPRGMRWLLRIDSSGPIGSLTRTVQRRFPSLARVAGANVLIDLAELFSLVQSPIERMLQLLERAQGWLRSDDTEILLVTVAHDDAATQARRMAEALSGLGLRARAVIANRALPLSLQRELLAMQPPWQIEGESFVRYARACATIQSRVIDAIAPIAREVIVLESERGLEGAQRLESLAAIGDRLRDALWGTKPQ